jgi:haloalkane dehalogenase
MSEFSAKRSVEVHGLKMAYVEKGVGDAVVFLHGNPTSSYLWRNIIPYLEGSARCIAPDLIGMGDSDKLAGSGPDSYTFAQHSKFLDGFLESISIESPLTLVLHDWGSTLGFDWARRHSDAVRGIAYMEPIAAPWQWADFPEQAQAVFKALRSPQGERLILEENRFIEQNLPRMIMRPLTDAEMTEYRRPFDERGEARRPTLTWPRQLPIEGDPADVVAVVERISQWLSSSAVPKLFIESEPGTAAPRLRALYKSWPNQTEVTVRGLHYPQEDSPREIGEALAAWYRRLA